MSNMPSLAVKCCPTLELKFERLRFFFNDLIPFEPHEGGELHYRMLCSCAGVIFDGIYAVNTTPRTDNMVHQEK